MNQGQVYAIQFPYNSINGVHDPSAEWDYWTGKYLLIESTQGPHIISGRTAQTNKVTNATISSGAASLFGNASFAEIVVTPPANTTLWALEKLGVGEEGNDTERDIHQLQEVDMGTITPAEGFLLAQIPTRNKMRARSINYKSGEVIYEETEDVGNDNPGVATDLPTIMGDVALIVMPTETGLVMVPKYPQQVMIYDVEGKLIFNQYVVEEQAIALPSSMYIVRGEQDKIKVVKK